MTTPGLLQAILFCTIVTNPFVSIHASTSTNTCVNGICESFSITVYNNGEWDNGTLMDIYPSYCSEKKSITQIICLKMSLSNQCQVYSRLGVPYTSCDDLSKDDQVFLVPNARVFIWPGYSIGHVAEVKHMSPVVSSGDPIAVETISLSPRVFRLHNFFSDEEANFLIDRALSIEDDEHKLKRSSTGAVGYNVDSKRTSDNAFDTASTVAMALKRRSFDLLGIRPYDETWADGLQILRYNVSQAYISHMDWIEGNGDPKTHNWDSAGEGTNRFATILLYLSELPDNGGGETVFSRASPSTPLNYSDASMDADIEARNLSGLFPSGSWERNLVHTCRRQLTVKPLRNTAVLFYSQQPDGQPDYLSQHAACPVLEGVKWAANIWVWNGPRHGYWERDPESGIMYRPDSSTVQVYFRSTVDLTDINSMLCLYWLSERKSPTFMGEISTEEPLSINSFVGHRWEIRLESKTDTEARKGSSGRLIRDWVLPRKPIQHLSVTNEDLFRLQKGPANFQSKQYEL